jgi:glycosyltransferase involved in cell wall biosynthesis
MNAEILNVDNPHFSVLIANFNNGKYLMDCIASVRAQTYTNWEIVLVDDGSTDDSSSLYKQLEQDSRIHIYFNEENRGCGYTKNRCVQLANGEICGFLDADDTLEKDALRVMSDVHRERPDVSLAYSLYNEVDENMGFISVSKLQKPIQEGKTLIDQQVVSHFVSFKKSSYKMTEGISTYLKCAEDHDLYFKLEEVGKLAFVDKVLYNYRTNTGQNTSLGKNEQKASFWNIIVMMEACRRRGVEWKLEETVYPAYFNYMEEYADMKVGKEVEKVRKTRAYRLGKTLLRPFVKKGHHS